MIPMTNTTCFTRLVCTLFITLFTGLSLADGNAPYVYEGRISGVFCSACSTKVKVALSTLPGVSKVKITMTEELGVQALRVESTSDQITKDAAVLALGDSAREFTLHSLQRRQ